MFFLAFFVVIISIILIIAIINNSYFHAIKNAQKHIIASLTEPAIVIDSKEKIVFFNEEAQRTTSITTEKAIGQQIDTVVKLYSDQSLVSYASYAATTKSQLTLHKENNEKLLLMVTLTKNALGSKDYSMITLLDISKEQQLEEMKVDFVSMAAHELRTPLTAIRGYASLLQMHYATNLDESAKELLIRLIVSTSNLANLIDNLLSVSRIEKNNVTLDIRPIDLGIIVKDIFSSFKQQALTRKQNLTLSMPDNLPLVMADPFRIGQVFINLISNALVYTPANGNITVTVADRRDHLEISVRDTGEGIPKEAFPRLFTKFFRVSGSLEQGSKGSGIGLYITKSIVESHQGKIWAESTPGKGSIFTFTLPVATAEQKMQHQQQTATHAFLTVKNGQGIIVRNNNSQSFVL